MFRNKIPKTDILLKYSIGKSIVDENIKEEESLNFKKGKSNLEIPNSVKVAKTMKGEMYQKLDSAFFSLVFATSKEDFSQRTNSKKGY